MPNKTTKKQAIYRDIPEMGASELIQVLQCHVSILKKNAKRDKLGWLGAEADFMEGVLQELRNDICGFADFEM